MVGVIAAIENLYAAAVRMSVSEVPNRTSWSIGGTQNCRVPPSHDEGVSMPYAYA